MAVGLAGLALTLWAVATRPAHDIAWIEVAAIAAAFFGGTAVVSLRRLRRCPGNDRRTDRAADHGTDRRA